MPRQTSFLPTPQELFSKEEIEYLMFVNMYSWANISQEMIKSENRIPSFPRPRYIFDAFRQFGQ